MLRDKSLEVDQLVVADDDVRVIHFHLLDDLTSFFAQSLVAERRRRRQVLVLAVAVHVLLFVP